MLATKRLTKIAIISVVLVALYALFGFFLLPRLLKHRLVKGISDYTGCPAALGKVSVDPFALSITLRDFSLPDRSGEKLLSFQELYVNFESSSLFRGGYAFSEIRLLWPYLRLLNRADGSVNLQEIMPPEEEKSPEEPPPTVFIDHLLIDQAEIIYEDRQRPTPFLERLDSLDLSLRNFATRPGDEGVYQIEAATDKGEGLKWWGNISVIPLHSSGSLALTGIRARSAWEYLQDRFNFEITGGLADIQGDYELDFAAEPGMLNLRNGKVALRDLAILDNRDSTKAVTIPTLSINGLESEIINSTLRIGEIESRSGALNAAFLTDSTLSLSTLFLPKPDTLAPDSSTPWQVTIDKVVLDDYAFHLEDRTAIPFVQLEFAPLNMTMSHFVYGVPGQTAQLEVAMRLKEGGRITAQGTLIPEPPEISLEVQVDSLPLSPFQPYVNRLGKIELKSGALSLAGHYHNKLQGEETFIDFKGEVHLERLQAVDPLLKEDFLRWGRLDVKGIDYRQNPPSLAMNEIVASRLYLRMIIGPDLTTNIQHILNTVPDSLTLADSTQAADAPVAADSAQETPTRIGQVRIIDGQMNFSDFSLTPNFNVSILELNGDITGLSSQQLDSAVVDLNGKVNKYAPVTISGLINLLAEEAFSDITMKFRNIELTTLTPYTGKFLGYKIDKGKLNLDLHYVLSGRYLNSENHIVLDHITLGEKVESPDAASLPLKLAIALLKDSHGVIDLNIPVQGSLDDPEFSVMPIIWKALRNLLVKAVTSPFKLLGALLGGGKQDLEYVNFSPGADSLAADQQTKLDSLARALTERPGLRLDVRGVAAPSVDREALANQAVTAEVLPNGESFEANLLTKEERERLFELYTATFNEDPYSLVPKKDESGEKIPREERDLAVAEAAFRQLVADYPVSVEELRLLAQRRAVAIKDRLVLVNGIEVVRVYLLEVATDASAEGGEVRLQLALDAR